MDFTWTKQQLDFQQQVIKFAQDNLNGDIRERDYQETSPTIILKINYNYVFDDL